MRRRARAGQGFTLLEVMISIAILSLGLTIVFGSSIMASRGTAHAHFVTQAALLARCRMTEAEAYLRINQLPPDDEDLDDPPDRGGERCCEAPFECTASVERIRLPSPVEISTRAGDRMLEAGAAAARGQTVNGGSGSGGDGGAGGGGGGGGSGGGGGGGLPMSQLAGALSMLGGPGGGGGMASALGSLGGGGGGGGLSGGGAPSMSSMAEQLMAGIYPSLQPLLEGAIRRVHVRVDWREGARRFHIDVNEYVTNPGQTMATGDQMNSVERALGGGTAGSGQPGATSGSGSTGQSPGASTLPPAPTITLPGLR